MASASPSNLAFFSTSPSNSATGSPAVVPRAFTVRCGRRGTRPQLVKGRILSTEAIQAIQALKRAYRTDPTNLPTHILSRLIKADLTAALDELLRQEQCALAATVFAVVRSEYGADLKRYADMAVTLSRNGLIDEIDALIDGLEKDDGIRWDESEGLLRLLQAVIGAQRKESTVRIYQMMKRGGLGSAYEIDEYLGRVLSKGLRGFGEDDPAEEVDRELGRLYRGNIVKPLT